MSIPCKACNIVHGIFLRIFLWILDYTNHYHHYFLSWLWNRTQGWTSKDQQPLKSFPSENTSLMLRHTTASMRIDCSQQIVLHSSLHQVEKMARGKRTREIERQKNLEDPAKHALPTVRTFCVHRPAAVWRKSVTAIWSFIVAYALELFYLDTFTRIRVLKYCTCDTVKTDKHRPAFYSCLVTPWLWSRKDLSRSAINTMSWLRWGISHQLPCLKDIQASSAKNVQHIQHEGKKSINTERRVQASILLLISMNNEQWLDVISG